MRNVTTHLDVSGRLTEDGRTHSLGEVGVELQHVVELFLQRRRLQRFVLVVLQQIRLQTETRFSTRTFTSHLVWTRLKLTCLARKYSACFCDSGPRLGVLSFLNGDKR